MVSAVSGGSITAAYYTLYGDRVFSDYESRFLKQRVQTGLLLRLLAPWNLARVASPKYGSSELAAECYDHLLFKGATFADLAPRPGRPFLIVNATDLAIGARVEFTQDQFDLLHSDLSKFPHRARGGGIGGVPALFRPGDFEELLGGPSRAGARVHWVRFIQSNGLQPVEKSRVTGTLLR